MPRLPFARSLLAALLAPLLLAPLACAPGGEGGSGLLDGIDFGDGEPGDVGGGGQPSAFLVQYPQSAGYARLGEQLEPLAPSSSVEVDAYTISPPLPEGLEIDPETGVISGAAQVASPPTIYTVFASAAIGTASAEVVIEIAGPTRFAFVTNAGDNTVSSFSVDAESGRLRHLSYHNQSAFQVDPEVVALQPYGPYLYTANLSTATLAVQRIDPATGALEDLDTEAIGHGPHALAVHPSGAYVYALSNAVSTLRVYRVEEAGTLDQVGSSIGTLDDPIDVEVAPNGRYLLVVYGAPGVVQAYRIDASTGTPQLVGELAFGAGSQPLGVEIGPQSENAYVTLGVLESVVRVSIQPKTAAMTMGGTAPVGPQPTAARLDPRGRFLYVPHQAGPMDEPLAGVTRIEIDPVLGAFASLEDQPLDPPPNSLRFARDGSSAYDLDRVAMTVTRYSVNPATGALGLGESVRSRRTPSAIALLSGDEPVVARATQLYALSEGAGTLSTFAIDPDAGALSPMGSPVAAGSAPVSLAVDPSQRYLWVGDGAAGSESLLGYALGEDGTPTATSMIALDGVPTGVAVEPSGRFLYVALDGIENRVQSYAIFDGGTLGGIDTDPLGPSPGAVSADPTGQFLYVVERGDEEPGDQGHVRVFSIERRTGVLTRVSPDALAGGSPRAFAFAPSAARAYSPYFNTDLLGTYDVQPATGTANVVLEATSSGNEPTDLVVTPTGRYAYVAAFDSAGTGAVELYDVRAADGVLYDSLSGELQARASFEAGVNPLALAVDPLELALYALNRGSGDLSTFGIVEANGALIEVDLDPVGLQPSALALSVRVR